MSDSSQLTVGIIKGNDSSGNGGRVNFPNGIIIADPPDGYYLGTTFVLPPSPFGPTPTPESRKIDMGGAQINIQANTTIGHMDVDDKMMAIAPGGTITITNDAFGDANNLTNTPPDASKSKIVSYTLVFGDPPFRS